MHHDAAPATILLVDDDAISIMAMKRALRKLNVRNETLVASDGLQALEVLRDVQVKGGGALPPFIVVLDILTPKPFWSPERSLPASCFPLAVVSCAGSENIL